MTIVRNMKSWHWFLAFGVLVATIITVDRAEDWLSQVGYPLTVWRVDLDDLLANLGLFLGGLAAFLMVFKRTRQIETQVAEVSERINGGMTRLAEEHVKRATLEASEAGHYISLLERITSLETQKHHCMQELAELRSWIEGTFGDTDRSET